MASIKLKFRPSSKNEKEGTVYFQIIHARKIRQIRSAIKIQLSEWDEYTDNLSIDGSNEERMSYLINAKRMLNSELMRIKVCVSELESRKTAYTVDDIVLCCNNINNKKSFLCFMRQMIELQSELGNYRLSEIYNTTCNCLMRYTNGNDLSFDSFDSHFIMSFETYLKKFVSMNTSSFYMRNLRAVYNRAVEEGIIEQNYPFRHVYTGVDKTIKRAVSLNVIRRLKNADLNNSPKLAFARDIFMFSFYTRGMAFIDIAYLKKSNLQNGRLVYFRRKTKQKLFIKWEQCMQEIVKRYSNPKSPYLLPILLRSGVKERNDYRNMSSKINERLRTISQKIGLETPVTMYVARHAWASIAKSKNIPLSIISEGMGHDSEMTTRIYLATLDTQAIDRANNIIIKSL